MANKGSFRKLSMACLLLLLSAFAVSSVAEVSGPFRPNGLMSAAADSSHDGRCGPTAGFGNRMADEQPISQLGEYQVVQCEKHLREHSTKLLHARVAGVKVAYPVFANSKDVPQSSALFDVSESSKQSSDSSPAKSSASSDSAEPVPVAVGFVVEISPAAATRRRHRALLQAATGVVTVVSTVPTAEDVSTINSWLGEFADQNQDLLLDGRDSITAGGFRKLSNGAILFTVYAVTTSSDLLVARVVELSEVASLNPGTSSARLFTPSDCVLSTEADVGFGTEEDLAAQLTAAPVSGCPSAQDIIVATPAATAPPAQPLAPTTTPQPVVTTTQGTTTTPVATTTPEATTTAPVTTTADPCPIKESLIQFGNALSPPPANWNSTTDLCDFIGLTCNATTDALIAMDFSDANYPGTLQPELSCVTDLQELQLGGNTLTGTLPPEWSTLTNLKSMRLSGNTLSGAIPSQWSELVSMEALSLQNCGINGSLPESLSTLTAMTDLFLHGNSFSGTLPPQWSEFVNIEYLFLGYNDLTGALPAEWSALASIRQLQLGKNDFNKTALPDQWTELADTLIDQMLTLTGNDPEIYDSDVPAAWKTGTMAGKWKVDTSD